MNFEPIEGTEELKGNFDTFFREVMKKAPQGWSNLYEDIETEGGLHFVKYVLSELGKRGWICMGWPRKYGGLEKSVFERLAFSESMAYWWGVGTEWMFRCGPDMVGPSILHFGTEEQKERFLPPIAKGEEIWAQLWSEPEAGSDLANIKTMAKLVDGYYVVNGQKVWTTGAHHAQWGIALVRSNPEMKKSRGLSYLIVDMKSPGITIRPLPIMSSHGSRVAHFNEVFFDDVRVPAIQLLGRENEAWEIIRASMNFERLLIPEMVDIKRSLSELIEFFKDCAKWTGGPELVKYAPIVRSRLAQLAIEIEVAFASARHVLWAQYKVSRGLEKPVDLSSRSSSIKYFVSELYQRLQYTGLEIMGLYGQLKRESKWAPMAGKFESLYQYAPGMQFAGGSTEVQKNIIAWEGLGLPRV